MFEKEYEDRLVLEQTSLKLQNDQNKVLCLQIKKTF